MVGSSSVVATNPDAVDAPNAADQRTTLIRHIRRLFPPSLGLVAFLVPWLVADASYLDVVVAGALPAAMLLGVLLIVSPAVRSTRLASVGEEATAASMAASMADEPGRIGRLDSLLIVGGSLAVMGAILVVVETSVLFAMLAGVLTTGGSWLIISAVHGRRADGERSALRNTFEPFLVGSLYALRRLAALMAVLAFAGVVAEVLRAAGAVTALSLPLVSLSGGSTVVFVCVVVVGCLVLGWLVSALAAYGLAAALAVPLIQSQAAVGSLSAHLVVWYGVVLGSALVRAGPPVSSVRNLADALDPAVRREIRERAPLVAALCVFPVAIAVHPRLTEPTLSFSTARAIVPVWLGALLLGSLTWLRDVDAATRSTSASRSTVPGFDGPTVATASPVSVLLTGVVVVAAGTAVVGSSALVRYGALIVGALGFFALRAFENSEVTDPIYTAWRRLRGIVGLGEADADSRASDPDE